jgi:peptide/nickel transport system substrate-binding protein
MRSVALQPRTGRRRARPVAVALAAATALLLAACTSSAKGDSTAGKPTFGGNLVIDGTQPIVSLDKDRAAASNDGLRVIENVYDRLYVLDANGKAVPSLASSDTESADQLTWTFQLRSGVMFSNGTPLTASDVVFSLDLARKGIYLGSLYNAISSVSAPDDHTIVVKTKTPEPAMLDKLTLVTAGVIPNNYGGLKSAAFWNKPIGSGPWKVEHFTSGRTVELVPNPRYAGAKPYLRSVTLNLVTDANTRMLQLFNGQAQLAETPSNAQLNSIKANAKSTVLSFPSTETDFVYLNTTKAPLNDRHFRRAISLALDRQSIIKAALLGHGSPAATWVSKQVLAGYQPADGIRFDLGAARSELAQSASPHGAKITLSFVTGGTPAWSSVAQVMQQELKAIGIDLTIRSTDANSLNSSISKKTYDLALALVTYDIPDPGELVDYYVGTNSFNSYDPATDVKTLHARGSGVSGSAARIDLYKQVADALVANADTIGIYSVPFEWGASRRLHGMAQTATGQFSFSKLWLS